MTSQVKKNYYASVLFVILMTIIDSSAHNNDVSPSSLTGSEIPTDISQPSSYFNAVSHESSEQMKQNIKSQNINENIVNEMKITTSSIVLQPNIAGALDVGQGLLVPLVPVIDPNSNNNKPQSNPLVKNLLPVSVETITPEITSVDHVTTEVEMRLIDDDMDVAEDIIFRPLFRYRQELATRRKSYNQNRYYQPYIYAYKPSSKNNYNDSDRQYLRYYPRNDDGDDNDDNNY